MSVFVSGCQHDIFVSYAHVDDQLMPGAEEGWVSTLITGLKTRLDQKLGRRDAYDLWKDDERLSGNDPLTDALLDTVRKSATLVVILSPGYLASDWCGKERNVFLQMAAQRAQAGGRLFVVERDMLELDKKPVEFRDLLGYQFWVQDRKGKAPRILGDPIPDPREVLYYDKLTDLANELSKELQRLKSLVGQPVSLRAETDTRPTVFLAEVTDDLDVQRDRVQRHLDQIGYRAIPADASFFSRYLTGDNQVSVAIAQEIRNCKRFVQLLSGLTGKCRPGQPSFPLLQYRAAHASGIPIMQWCDPQLDPTTIENQDHRALLEGERVFAIGLEEFKQQVETQLRAKPKRPNPVVNPNLVFLNTSSEDQTLGEDISRALKAYGVDCALPARSSDSQTIQQDLELSLSECDGLIVVYGPTTYAWARAQLLRSRRIIGLRDRPLKALAVYEGPPEDKDPLGLELHNMLTLNCRAGFSESGLQVFLEALQAG